MDNDASAKRYECVLLDVWNGAETELIPTAQMCEEPDGDYVHHDDYEACRKHRDAAVRGYVKEWITIEAETYPEALSPELRAKLTAEALVVVAEAVGLTPDEVAKILESKDEQTRQ